jgi:outer membrane protein TolC
MLKHAFFSLLILFITAAHTYGQEKTMAIKGGTVEGAGSNVLTLNDCISFALKNQPAINQAGIGEDIAHTNNKIAFSSWLPQVNANATLQHYFSLRTAFFNSNGVLTPFRSGVINNSVPQLNATQTIFNPDVLFALKASKLNTANARLETKAAKIAVKSEVTKAFYNLLLSIEQVNVFREDTVRLNKNLSDAYHRYVSGITDKVDYKRASISLNNSLSRLNNAAAETQVRYAALKQLMGYPSDKTFTVRFDTAQLMQEIFADTNTTLRFEKRIEYQQLQTAKRMQHETTRYYRSSFLPSLSGYYNYVHEFQNNEFSDLYNQAYPYSFVGLQLNIPIFSGFRRMENIRKAKLQEQRTDWDEINLKLAIYTEYRQALSNYKSNLYNLRTQGENTQMAREVYNIVKLQYSEGIKSYLDVIIAESDLQTSEINYLNALFSLLSSKIDLERAMGNISPDN